jgi:putative ABC transport system permease protein
VFTDWVQDVRYAFRALRRSPGFAALAVTTLALGIGANSAIFAVLDSVLFQALPYPDADRVVYVWETREGSTAAVSAPDFTDWQTRAASFAAMGARRGAAFAHTGGGEPERLRGARVSAGYFRALGLQAQLGRLFDATEDRHGAERVVVLGHGWWTRRFGADPSIIGRPVLLNGHSYTVVGVLEPHIRLVDDVWVPMAFSPAEMEATGSRAYAVMARLRAGVTAEQAQTEMSTIAAALTALRPHSNTGWGAAVVPLRDQILGEGTRGVLILSGAVGLVLLIACANVANLLLARALTRRQEIGVRAALGASRGRLIRQLLVESLTLATLGGLAGVACAYWGLKSLVSILPADIPRLTEVAMRPGALWLTAGATGLVGVLAGLLPALVSSGAAAQEAVRQGSRGSTGGRRRWRDGLVAAEVALAVTLLAGAGLLVRSVRQLWQVRPGVDAEQVLALQLNPPAARYGDPAQAEQLYRQIVGRARTLPGIDAAAVSINVPLTGSGPTISFSIDGAPEVPPQDLPVTLWQVVGTDYFRTLGIPLLQGRAFEETDRSGSPRVGVINETMAGRYWPGASPLGQRVTLDDGGAAIEIVGVVSDVRHYGPREAAEPEIYLSLPQIPADNWRWFDGSLHLLVRARTPAALAPAIRQAVWEADRDVPISNIRTLAEVRGESVSATWGLTRLIGLLAAVAAALAAVGIYGVVSFTVGQRTRELGIRISMGARRSDVLRLVVGQGLKVIALGTAAGLLGALLATRVLRASLFGVGPADPVTLAAITLLIVTVGTAACYLPARRAARLDPLEALRHE